MAELRADHAAALLRDLRRTARDPKARRHGADGNPPSPEDAPSETATVGGPVRRGLSDDLLTDRRPRGAGHRAEQSAGGGVFTAGGVCTLVASHR